MAFRDFAKKCESCRCICQESAPPKGEGLLRLTRERSLHPQILSKIQMHLCQILTLIGRQMLGPGWLMQHQILVPDWLSPRQRQVWIETQQQMADQMQGACPTAAVAPNPDAGGLPKADGC